jgi:hypothetical protein
MSARVSTGAVLALLSVVGFFVWNTRRDRLDELRREHADHGTMQAVVQGPGLRVETTARESESQPIPLSPDETMELMQLRNRVATLRERQRAMAGVSNANVRLKEQLVALTNYSRGMGPPGYIRRAQAQYRGAGTPEATLESFLWAIEQRNAEVLSTLLNFGDDAGDLGQRKKHAEKFIEELDIIPGARIVGRTNPGPDRVELQLTFDPLEDRKDKPFNLTITLNLLAADPPEQHDEGAMRRPGGAWRLNLKGW